MDFLPFDLPLWVYATAAGVCVFLLLLLWQLFGRGPRRRRGIKRASQRLQQGRWQEARERVQRLRALGFPSAAWRKRFDDLEANCLQQGLNEALAARDFETARHFAALISDLKNESHIHAAVEIQSAMLEEVRRLFSEGNNQSVYDMIEQVLGVQTPCREASFWQGLCLLREGRTDTAMSCLQVARGDIKPASPDEPAKPTPSTFVDPAIYLGALLLRQGQPKDALIVFTEANRIDSGCSVTGLLLGAAMIAAGNDPQIAVRALQRALGPRGLGAEGASWATVYPEFRSYIHRLASKYAFTCPLWGSDLKLLMRQGTLALAQGLDRLGQYQESSELFAKCLAEGAPSLGVVRGLGLSLARLGKYDDAFKHLRAAHEMEEPKERLTAGYLALCGAMGTPSSQDDKEKNVVWAVQLATSFSAPRDPEWIALIGKLFVEARANNVSLTADDEVYLCEHLLSTEEVTLQAADAYQHLQAHFPHAMRPEYAWLGCWSVHLHDLQSEQALPLFAITFKDEAKHRRQTNPPQDAAGTIPSAEPPLAEAPPADGTVEPAADFVQTPTDAIPSNTEPMSEARQFYEQHGWNFDALEYTFLKLAAQYDPGLFPLVLGEDYAPLGQQLLLNIARSEEAEGRLDAARTAAETLLKLAPQNRHAYDLLARLMHLMGKDEEARAILRTWQEQHPGDPLPCVREAIYLYQQGDLAAGAARLQHALNLAQGHERARIACLGSRLSLQCGRDDTSDIGFQPEALAAARNFLEESLRQTPDHLENWWMLAGVCWLQRDNDRLAQLAGSLPTPSATSTAVPSPAEPFPDPSTAPAHFHYFAALCKLAAGDFAGALEHCQPAPVAEDESLLMAATAPSNGDQAPNVAGMPLSMQSELRYLAGLAHLARNNLADSEAALTDVVAQTNSPTRSLAQALLGAINFEQGRHRKAADWWQQVDPRKRQQWKLAEPMSGTMFLAAIEAIQASEFETAAETLRTAGKLGWRDRNLGTLLIFTLFLAGQQAFYGSRTNAQNGDVTLPGAYPEPNIATQDTAEQTTAE